MKLEENNGEGLVKMIGCKENDKKKGKPRTERNMPDNLRYQDGVKNKLLGKIWPKRIPNGSKHGDKK
jgi:hypothetical protein